MVRRCLVLHFLVVRLVSTLAAVGCLIKIYYKEIRTVGQIKGLLTSSIYNIIPLSSSLQALPGQGLNLKTIFGSVVALMVD